MKKKWSNKMGQSSSLKKIFALGAASLGALTIMGAANDAAAQSLPMGCQNADHVRSTLQAEGQFVLVTAVAPIPERPRNIFTSNASGSFGYNIEQGTGDTTGKLCVMARYTDVRVNTNIQGNTPQWALIGDDSAHNRWLENQRVRTNERVLLGATIVRSDGSRGGFMMVTRGTAQGAATTQIGGAITLSFNDTGEIRPQVLLGDVNTQEPNYTAFVNASRQVASLNPSN